MYKQRFIVTAALVLVCLTPPLLAGTRIERELALSRGGRLIVDTDHGSVEVVGTSRSNALIVITSRRDDIESKYDVRLEERSGDAVVQVERKNKTSKWFNWSGSGLRFEIEVPEGTELDIDTAGGSISVENTGGPARLDTSGGSISASRVGRLLADTSGGSITVEDADGDVTADTSGGSIRVSNVRGKVSADTSGGSITVSDVTGDVNADTSGGPIRVEEVGGRVRADTSGGGITVTFARGNQAGGELATSGGGIEVRLDPSVNLEIDAASSGGSVTADIPVTVQGKVSRTSLRGKVGSGGEMLRIRSSGGGVRIKPY